MKATLRTLADAATYKRLLYVLLGWPLGLAWLVCLITLWSLCFGLAVTPLVIPALLALSYATRLFAAIEAALARSLLDTEIRPPGLSVLGGAAGRSGLRGRLRALFGEDFWRAQAFLWARSIVGFTAGVVLFSLLATALAMVFGPIWIPLVHEGADLGVWHVHSFAQSLALVVPGLVLLALTILLALALGEACALLAGFFLGEQGAGSEPRAGVALGTARDAPATARPPTRRGLAAHALVDGAVGGTLIVIWAVTSRGYFWPIWLLLPLATAIAMHAWIVELHERPGLVERFRGSLSLAASAGIATAFWLFTVGVWAVSSSGYFWPLWNLLALALILSAHMVVVLLSSPGEEELTERIDTLTATRAGAVDVQESELRRIERDLHDGAQARLVALGMSLGMAEQTLAEDPERAARLLAEARAGAEEALRELRDLARGIHPPVLADRGLEAALAALVNLTPMEVSLSVDVPNRPPAAVESAAYFVVAEAIANATKHAQAQSIAIRIIEMGGSLELEITDDGVGGANPEGSGLRGLRQRVGALDGTLRVTSPPGGPTRVYAALPCA